MRSGTLLYDADCGFCTRSAGWFRVLAPGVGVEAMTANRLAELGVDPERASREIPFVGEAISYGAEAIGRALAAGRWPWRGIGLLIAQPPVLWVARPIYRLVAKNRHRLPGGQAECRLDPVS
ncbi:MAG: DUF393 domain-containing protein [Micropruina sp.]|nr:DUF393 domain-containing protein [Micropruina sp.]